MIFKIKLDSGRVDFVQATDYVDLFQKYTSEYADLYEIVEVKEISDEEAKEIILANPDYDKDDPNDTPNFSLYDLSTGNDFEILGSSYFD